jgi:hypothetical protein
LSQDLGRSLSTLKNYVPFVDQFLLERFHNRAPNFTSLRAPDVTRFVMRHAHQLSPLRAGLMVTALRSFFRYLRHRGAIATDLAGCVPTVPIWSLSTLPRYLPTAAVERLLKRCDRKTAVGRRNHAILLLLARLGVRAGEVMGLSLDDIDWSTGLITIHGKGGKSAQLPLPPDARAALAAYLRRRGTIGPPLPSLQGRPIDVCSNALRRGARLLVDTHGRKHFVTAMVIPSIAMLPSLSAPIRVTADLCPQAVFRRRRNTGLPPSTTMEFHVSPLPRCPWLSSAGALQIQCSSLATVIIRETFVRAVSLRIPSTGRDSWTL